MRKITGQTIASTTLDLQGESIPPEQLQSLFEQMPDTEVINQDHDLSKPIIAKVYNKRFVKIDDGHHAIQVDVDVIDEAEFAKRGGFSISFYKKHYTLNSLRDAEVTVIFNPRLIPTQEITPLVGLTDQTVQIDAKEIAQKGVEPITILVIAFIANAVAGEFFKKAGADAYELLKSKLKELAERRRAQGQGDLKFHFSFTAQMRGNPVDVLIESDTDNLSVIAEHGIALQEFLDQLEPYSDDYRITRVSLQVSAEYPYLQLAHMIDENGNDRKLARRTGA